MVQSKCDIVTNRYTNEIKSTYESYVKNGGDGKDVFKSRGETLGYHESFLKRCNIMRENDGTYSIESQQQQQQQQQLIKELFMASCGSGCPLRIDGDKHLPKEGDMVVDLGCGAGHDSILASGLIGPTGRVFGVDFTQAMIDQSQKNAETYTRNDHFAPLVFCKGSIDDPVEFLSSKSNSVLKKGCADVVISNGVLNLCLHKPLAFQTAFDLLKPGGKFLLSDVCSVEENPSVKIMYKIGCEISS